MSQAAVRTWVRRALWAYGAVAAAILIAQFALMVWTRHDSTDIETVVAYSSLRLARGETLYTGFRSYPFLHVAYGPVFYAASATVQKLGAAPLLAGRLISAAALLGILAMVWRLTRLLTPDRLAAWLAVALAASLPIVSHWGTTGQVDALALFLSLAAFYWFCRWRAERAPWLLWLAGALWVAALLTKQSSLAAGAAILAALLLESRRRAAVFAVFTGGAALLLAWALNAATDGRFLENAVLANMNPISAAKLHAGAVRLAVFGGIPLGIAIAGFLAARPRALHPIHLYLGASVLVWALTSGKIGAALNYQMETLVVLSVLAAWSLDRLDFFRTAPVFAAAALLLQFLIGVSSSRQWLENRRTREYKLREVARRLAPYVAGRTGRILCVETDAMLTLRGRLDAYLFVIPVLAGGDLLDTEPIRRDLAARRVPVVVLYQDVFAAPQGAPDLELASLAPEHLEELRRNYRLVGHMPGMQPEGLYLYEPKPDAD